MRFHQMAWCAVVLATCSPCFGAVLYSATTDTSFRFNPGAGGIPNGTGVQQDVTLDDVQISNPLLMPQASITRVTVGVRRLANAPAVTVSCYASSIGGAPDFVPALPLSSLGTVSLPANGASAMTELVSMDLSSSPLLINLNNTLLSQASTNGAFAIGLQFGGPNAANQSNGWRHTTADPGFANASQLFWLYDTDQLAAVQLRAFSFGTPSATVAPSTFYIVVEGTLVPAPGMTCLGGIAAFSTMRRPRRSAR